MTRKPRRCLVSALFIIACGSQPGGRTSPEPEPPPEPIATVPSDSPSPADVETDAGVDPDTETAPQPGTEMPDTAAVPNKADSASQENTPQPVPTHEWRTRDKMESVVRKRYELPPNRDWTDNLRVECVADYVRYHNGVKRDKEIPEGATIQMPDRARILIEAGFPSIYETELKQVFEAENLFYIHGYKSIDYLCDDDKPVAKRRVPKAMKKDFDTMAAAMMTLKTKLEETEKKPISPALKKVTDSLNGLHYTFKEVVDWQYDEQYCDLSAKELTCTKRSLSNLNYRLYKWAVERKENTDAK